MIDFVLLFMRLIVAVLVLSALAFFVMLGIIFIMFFIFILTGKNLS